MKTASLTRIIFYFLLPMIFLGSYLVTAVNEVNYGLNRDYAEGTTLAFVEKFRNAESLKSVYSEEALEKSEIVGYPFLHLSLVSSFSHNANSTLTSGRTISVISALLIALLAWMILFKSTVQNLKYLPLLAVLILYQSAVFDWSLLARADLLAALFEVLGILLFAKSVQHSKRSYAAPFVCFILAFLCKQNFIAGPLLIAGYQLFNNRRSLLKATPLILVGVALLGTAITWVLGPSYWQHTVTQLQEQSFHFSRLLEMGSGYLVAHLFLFALAFVGFRTSQHQLSKKFLPLWFAITALLVLLGLGRSGSNFNYFISMSIPLGLLAFLGIQEILKLKLNSQSVGILALLLFSFSLNYAENHNLAGKFTYLSHRAWPPTRHNPESALATTKEYLNQAGAKAVFCDEPGVCALMAYPVNYMYFENQMNAETFTAVDLIAKYDALLFTEYPDKNLAWTKFKLPKGLLENLNTEYELQRITDLGFIFVRRK
ncbi:hypothetical protein [Bdellovibrio sp. HCB274]|uniref:hypothetical protein n=1 Tax=Bdellovibrio sp. HCB274 TaxID=3394361 RepID=UPI0039B61E01